MCEIVVSFATTVGKYLIAPIGNQFNYLYNYKTNVEKLKTEVEKLIDARESMQHRVDDAKRQGEVIEHIVEKWLSNVNKIIDEVGKDVEDEKTKNRCFKGLCPNFKTHYQLSKKAMTEVEAIVGFLKDVGKFHKVSYSTIPDEIWISSTKGYEAFESRVATLKGILDTLSNPNANIIGVYGIGGVGKTTLVKEIARQAMKHELFHDVVFVEVSDRPNIKQIQGEIADKIGLKLFEESESGRARKLCNQLLKVKKILVILDNIWAKLDLEAVGIPFGHDDRGCKVLLTARSVDVLSNKMDCQINFLLNTLNEEEAWSLFKKMAGDRTENQEFQSVAKDIVETCGGLPIAIVTIARALRNKSLSEWKDSLRQLRRPYLKHSTEVQSVVYSTIELSYNHLENEELKATFLLCSITLNNSSISTLLKYTMGLGLFQGIKTMEEGRDRVCTFVHKLKESCLLLDGEHGDRFSMHDFVRDVAISIASREHHVFSVRDDIIKWPDEDMLKNCTAISLRRCNISELPEGFECPELTFLLINDIGFSQVPEKFFTGMVKLRVLRLIQMQLLSLPSSLCLLVNLRTLCLDHSELGDVSIVGELTKLEILSFRGSNIGQLPREISQLTQLRLLDLSKCAKLKVIVPNVISSLSNLEELFMCRGFTQWDVSSLNIQRSNASLDELKHLSLLTTLEIHVKDAKILPKGLFSKRLERYKIIIGDKWDDDDIHRTSRLLKVKLTSKASLRELTPVINNAEDLHLDEVQGVKNVLYELDVEGFLQLKHLSVQNNPYLKYIVDSMGRIHCDAFPLLESLAFQNLINLEKICHAQLTAQSFSKLRSVEVEKCDKLKNIFSFSIAKGLPQLQKIEVTECKNMKEIFAIGIEDNINNNESLDKLELAQLRSLTLGFLPELSSLISKGKKPSTLQKGQKKLTAGLRSDEVTLEERLDACLPLFSEKLVLPKLETLELSAINSEKIWHDRLPAKPYCFENLKSLIIQGCGKLKYLFPSSIFKSFVKLQHVEIRDCTVLEEVIVMEQLRGGEKDMIFSQLNFLKIENLKNLTSFCSESYIAFPLLKRLEIKQCPELKAFILRDKSKELTAGGVETLSLPDIQPFFNEKVAFPNLEELVVLEMDNLMMICHTQLTEDSFCKLKLMQVGFCNKLRTIFPSNMLGRLSRLESIIVADCGSLGEIFDLQGLNVEETHPIMISKLKELYISGLPKLRQICDKDPQGMLSFPELHVVRVFNCQSLKYLFPASIARSLLQLKELGMVDCGVEEIVANEGEAEEAAMFVFPQVTSLEFWNLTQLSTFYSGIHTSDWPMLKDLRVCGCDKLKIFGSELFSFQETIGEDECDSSTQNFLFAVEKVFPRLEALKLEMKDIMKIWQGQFPKHFFDQLKSLEVMKDESVVFPLGLLGKFCNLEVLTLSFSSYKELFSYEEVEKHAGSLARIKQLNLFGLFDLQYMWKENSKLNSVLQNLEILFVDGCDNMINVIPFSTSFQNLTNLCVQRCNILESLLLVPTAKSLVQLKDMRVHGCKMMKNIVANEGDVSEGEILFNKLECLSLIDLRSCESFCFGNYTFKFPSLEYLYVIQCPKLKIFSRGVLSTPKLEGVWHNEELTDWFWETDLNTTIQKIHEKKITSNNENCLEMGQPRVSMRGT